MRTAAPGRIADRVVEGGVLALLVFTPFAYGTVEPWSEAIAELVVLTMVLAWILGMWQQRELRTFRLPGVVPALLFLALVGVQIVPWPWAGASLVAAPLTLELRATASAFTGALPGTPPLSLDPHATRRALMKLAALAAFFLVVGNVYRTPRQFARARWVMVSVGALLAVFAVVQRATWSGRFYWVGPEAPHPLAFGPFVNRAHFAGLMAVVVSVAAAIVLDAHRRAPWPAWRDGVARGLRSWGAAYPGPVRLAPVVLLLTAGAVLASGSRGGLLTLAATGLTMIGVGALTPGAVRPLRAVVALALMVLVGMWIGGDIFQGTLERLVEEARRPEESSRLRIWTDAMVLWRSAPLLGTGLGTFDAAFPRVRTLATPWVFAHAESDWIQLLTDTGIAGLSLALCTLAAIGRALFRRTRELAAGGGVFALAALGALAGAAVQGATNFNLPVLSNFLYLAMAVAGGLAGVREESGRGMA